MISRQKYFLYIALILLLLSGSRSAFSQGDTLYLSQDDFFGYILKFHPLAKQADLISDRAKFKLRAARGHFDPKLYSDYNDKYFKGTDYWEFSESGLKIPTWFGVEVKAAFETSQGVYENPERNVPTEGLSVVGVSVPIGQDLIIDKRRTVLRQAKLFREVSEAERIAMLNELLFDAADVYWKWVQSYFILETYDEAIDRAEERFEIVKQSFRFGAMSAVDTLESLIQLQTMQIDYYDATLEYQKSRLNLSNFFWDEDEQPLEITDSIQPYPIDSLSPREDFDPVLINLTLDSLVENHPAMQQYRYKISFLNVEKRYYANTLLPKFRVNYNLLTSGYESMKFSDNDYKWGFSFSYPLFLRKERGKLQLTEVKILETDYQMQVKRQELLNKMRFYQSAIETYNSFFNTYEESVINYRRLLSAEEIKFRSGASSLFKLNDRIQKLLRAEQKLIQIRAKYYKSVAGLAWASGQLSLINPANPND